MPELPDVEIFKQYMDATALHQKTDSVRIRNKKVLADVSSKQLQMTLKGRRFESTTRHGKHLLAQMDNGKFLTIHFGMTGFLKYYKNTDDEPEHSRVLIRFTNGFHLAYVCQRMLGKVGLADSVRKFIEDRRLGPDALNLDMETFHRMLAGKRGSIKSALMNQNLLAGMGNIYSEEILYHSGVRPTAQVKSLNSKTIKKIFRNMKKVLDRAIECRVDPAKFPNSYLLPHRHKGEECPRCGATLQQEKVNQRTAYYCPECQPG
ncbi:MAG: formamidopyrimidine-DNA glycosylase [Candidatus Abyssubacteria bacterium]